jgi:hypothetical protein
VRVPASKVTLVIVVVVVVEKVVRVAFDYSFKMIFSVSTYTTWPGLYTRIIVLTHLAQSNLCLRSACSALFETVLHASMTSRAGLNRWKAQKASGRGIGPPPLQIFTLDPNLVVPLEIRKGGRSTEAVLPGARPVGPRVWCGQTRIRCLRKVIHWQALQFCTVAPDLSARRLHALVVTHVRGP